MTNKPMFHAMNAQFDSTMVGQGGSGHNEELSSRRKVQIGAQLWLRKILKYSGFLNIKIR
jgi:hypothetical protein